MSSKLAFSFVAGCFLALATIASAQAQLPQPVTTTLGLVQGEAANGISVFRGIPFAAPPVGENRWREPQPAAAWSGVRNADRFAPRCVQRGFAPGAEQAVSSEDCLYLNVWTPATAASARLPVLVWIHGGGFFGGSGSDASYAGTHLAERGAIVVTINYRLGVFGFLAHPQLTAESPHHSSGNYALLDMLAALQWVHANIGAFGGDVDNVTIVGESAGAQSVAVLVASPLSKGLFRRAIVQSGGWMGLSQGKLPTLAEREQQGRELAGKFGAASLSDLRKASTAQVFAAFPNAGSISVDGYFLPRDPSLIFAAGEQQPADVLAGSNANEAAFFGPGLQTIAEVRDYAQAKFAALTPDFTKLYQFKTDAEANQIYLKAFSADLAWHVRRLAQYQHDKGQQAYAYFFSHVPPGQEARGATHVAELAYMFNQSEQNPKWTDADKRLSDQMASYWVNFARTGNPNGTGLPQWSPYVNGKTTAVMGFAEQAAMMKNAVPSAGEIKLLDANYQRVLKELTGK